MTRRGFTLIELLVVIAIIAILASILFPVFARAREKARQTSCLSNVKQIMLSITMYSQDYDETYPSLWVDVDGSGDQNDGDYTWRSAVLPYIKNTQIFQCPSKRMSNSFNGGMDYGTNSGYGLNAVHWEGGAPTPPFGQTDAAVEFPSECIFMGEIGEGAIAISNGGDNAHGFVRNDEASKRHNEGSNYGYCDGHAKWQKPSSIRCADGDCQFSISGQ
jgi:prepilin-type N-terminal cleavage/methylation domain-containing protein/prepilin-type processing-associated H-X9-DG protein